MSPTALRASVLAALAAMLAGVALAATAAPKAGAVLVLAGWIAALGALHALGRAP